MGIFKVIRNTNDELQYLYNVLNYTMGIQDRSVFNRLQLVFIGKEIFR